MDLKENVYSSMPWLANYLQLAQVWMNPVRSFGWSILCGLGWLVDNMYDAYLALVRIDIYGMINSALSSVTGGIDVLWPAVLTLAITITGIIIMITAKKRKDLGNGIAVAVLLLITGPMLFSTCNNFLKAAVPWVEEAYGVGQTSAVYIGSGAGGLTETEKYDAKVSSKVISSGTYDLLKSVQNESLSKITITPDKVRINEKVGGYFGNSDLFPYWVEKVDPDGTMWGRELADDAWFMKNEINEGMYRYSFSFFGPFITLIILLIGISMGAFKTAKLMFELVFTQTLAPLVFASDVTNSGRSKEVVKKVISTYILIAIVFYGLMLFMTLSLWALDENNVPNIIVRVFLLAGISWGMIDGPDIVVKLLGIDAGVRSGFGALVGAGMAVGGASRMIRGGAQMAKGIAAGAVNSGRSGAQWAGKKMDAQKTKKNAPEGVNSALQGATRQSKNDFHDINSPSYHNVAALDHKDQYKGASSAAQAPGGASSTPQGEEAGAGSGKRPPTKQNKAEQKQSTARSTQRQLRNAHTAFPPSPPPQSGSGGYMAPPDLNQIDSIIEKNNQTQSGGQEPTAQRPAPGTNSHQSQAGSSTSGTKKYSAQSTPPVGSGSRPPTATQTNNTHLPPPGIRPMPQQPKPPERGDKK